MTEQIVTPGEKFVLGGQLKQSVADTFGAAKSTSVDSGQYGVQGSIWSQKLSTQNYLRY